MVGDIKTMQYIMPPSCIHYLWTKSNDQLRTIYIIIVLNMRINFIVQQWLIDRKLIVQTSRKFIHFTNEKETKFGSPMMEPYI